MELSHLDAQGNARMVDVSAKAATLRTAQASAEVILGADAYAAVERHEIAKGDVLAVARIAGIQAAKKTAELIPLCHPLALSFVDIQFQLKSNSTSIAITSLVKTIGTTGVEMEALSAVTVAALTVYDMCKAVNKAIRIADIHLVSKSGGKSGPFQAEDEK
ncbi:MAG: cyclic pyranopterin monophosphate synthase MoaC [Ignavibacteriales bacterium]|nr:cyclic pyranopterin monophosphate synthase MoaC [Ignavibacteriales bacterium]